MRAGISWRQLYGYVRIREYPEFPEELTGCNRRASWWFQRGLYVPHPAGAPDTMPGKCSDLRGSEQPAAFQEGIETSSPPGAKEGCQGHLAVGALP